MKLSFLLVTAILACSSKPAISGKKYIVMNTLWGNQATKPNVIKAFGSKYTEVQNGLTYSISGYTSTDSGHFFNENQRLIEQFIFLDESSLNDLKSSFSCKWNVSEKFESVGHTVYAVRSGKCVEKQISYEFKPGSNHYEVRWKK